MPKVDRPYRTFIEDRVAGIVPNGSFCGCSTFQLTIRGARTMMSCHGVLASVRPHLARTSHSSGIPG